MKSSRHPAAAYVTSRMGVGERVAVRSGGSFVYDTEDPVEAGRKVRRVLFIAGGVGINPLSAMLQQIHEAGAQCRTALLYSAKSEAELVFRADLDALAAAHPRTFCAYYTLTAAGSGGRFTAAAVGDALAWLAEGTSDATRADAVYVCDPPVMLEWAVCDPPVMLEWAVAPCGAHGVSERRVKFERWW